MDFFDKLSKKATETYKNVADKTNKMASESNIKGKMNENKKKITAIYTEIGKKVYQRYATDGNLDVKNDIQEELNRIDELAKEIEKAEEELLTLSGMKKCIKCNQNVPINSKFCPSCGAEQPEIVQEVKEAEVVDNSTNKEAPTEPEESKEQETIKEAPEAPNTSEVVAEVEAIVDETLEENQEHREENQEESQEENQEENSENN